MRIWILLFSTALFVGGVCLGIALQPRLVPTAKAEAKIDAAPPPVWGTHHKPEFSVHRFASELDLTAEQDREFDAILADSQEDTAAFTRAMRTSQDKTRERIMSLLTPEQKSKLDSLMAAERQKRADAELNRTVSAYAKILGLTDEQSQTLKTVTADARARRHDLKRGEDWQQARKTIRDDQNKKLEASFGPETFKRYLEVSELDRSDR
jgi:Spy/CpxP family protein refolding chaperone